MSNPKDAIVWFEIPVSNLENARNFYQQVMQVTLIEQEMGPNVSLIFPVDDMKTGVSGHLYQGKPGNDNGPSVHFDAPVPLEDTLKRLVSAGGSIVSEEFKIPSGRFVYCKDPDGNSISMFNRG
jgi:predicted enzyme related to lactoylglutathione lyase